MAPAMSVNVPQILADAYMTYFVLPHTSKSANLPNQLVLQLKCRTGGQELIYKRAIIYHIATNNCHSPKHGKWTTHTHIQALIESVYIAKSSKMSQENKKESHALKDSAQLCQNSTRLITPPPTLRLGMTNTLSLLSR